MTPRTFKQFALFKAPDLFHGSNLVPGKRKIARPLDPKRTIHLILKSSQSRGERSLLQPRYAKRIQILIEQVAAHYGIKIYGYANVGNHLHLLVKTKTRLEFQNFLRVIAGKIAILVTQAKKGQKKGKFWDGLSFTRVVHWGNDFKRLTNYFIKNQIESFGYGPDFAKSLVKHGCLILNPDTG